ncbi:CHAP domain-containing protein [Candidatus Saccharibacteria bacterium]|nr:CHAP domain-containing protein [Candidatus Saccharibacteria bacterium]
MYRRNTNGDFISKLHRNNQVQHKFGLESIKKLGRSNKPSKRALRTAIVGLNALLLVAVAVIVTNQEPKKFNPQSANNIVNSSDVSAVIAPLDQVSSADIAVNVARIARLPEANSVTNHADSVSVAAAMVAVDTSVVAKPQIISEKLPSKRDIVTYNADASISVSDLSANTGVTSDNIKWSNNISGSTIPAGTTVYLPPIGVNGIVYTVKSGDTPESLATKYVTDKDKIIQFNDAEISGLKVGERILIPGGVVQAPAVAVSSYAASSTSSSFAWGGSSPIYSANGYDYGWCTWHAANRRRETGRPIPSNLGNAISWYYIAKSAGLAVGNTPAAGAVLWHANIGGWGHVAYVESVNADGSILISDMNYPIWGKVTYRTAQPSEFGNYRFIY